MKKELQSKDLRIGNYVYDNHRKIVVDVALNTLRLLSYNVDDNNYTPIPLTEEWLERLGFEREEDEIHGEKTWDYQRDIEGRECWAEWNEKGQLEGVTIDCTNRLFKYVHEFQNLYFALTGEELELKSDNP